MLDRTLPMFIAALKERKSVVLLENGDWYCEGFFKSALRIIFQREKARVKSLAENFAAQLDSLEKFPIKFGSNNLDQEKDFVSYLQAGKKILARYYHPGLARRIVALEYRLESVNGGYDAPPSSVPDVELIEMAKEWKEEQVLIEFKHLTNKSLKQLLIVSGYPRFVRLLKKDPDLFDLFMQWAIRDHLSVPLFIQFPALQEKLISCYLSGRMARFGGEQVKIVKSDKKNVTLLFENREEPVLDPEHKITFRGNYTLTVGEIFEIFKNKAENFGNVECFREGIINWNAGQQGFWNADENRYEVIDVNVQGWWKQFPVIERLTKREVQKRYGNTLDGRNWNITAMATRQGTDLDLYNNHAYFEIAIPIGHGKYQILNFGKGAKEYPKDPIKRVLRVCENMLATISYPDDNIYYSHRQHAWNSFEVSPVEGMLFMESLKKDILHARSDNLVYQIESENCAEWVQLKLEEHLGKERVPNLFRMRYLNTTPTGVMGMIFNFVRKFPEMVQDRFLMLLHIPFGARTGRWITVDGKKVWKALDNHYLWHTAQVYLPAFLHHQKRDQDRFVPVYYHPHEVPTAIMISKKIAEHEKEFLHQNQADDSLASPQKPNLKDTPLLN